MPATISKDGTAIAYTKTGNGPAVILVNGALAYRDYYGEQDLANKLAKHFSVIFYDRRGRGESGDAQTYSVQREIEDIDALVSEAGGSVFLYGVSSGAVLALLAAEKSGAQKIKKLALYEPPFGSDTSENKQKYADEKRKVRELVADGKPGEAITLFLQSRGIPPKEMEKMKKSPDWKKLESIGHTLVYDFDILGDGSIPVDIAKRVSMPTLIMTGEKSFDFLHATADTLTKLIPDAQRKTLKGQTHEVSPDILAPVLIDFFNR